MTRPERSRPWLGWAALLGIFVVVMAGVIVSVTDWRYQPDQGWAAYVPADGVRHRDGIAGGRVWENAVAPGPWINSSIPASANDLIKTSDVELAREPWVLWWRSVLTRVDARAETRVFGYAPSGLEERLRYDDHAAVLFQPALPLLLRRTTIDSKWQQDGTAYRPGQAPTPYQARGVVDRPTDPAYAGQDCVAVSVELTLSTKSPTTERMIFCRGKGLVDVLEGTSRRTSAGGTFAWSAPVAAAPTRRWNARTWQRGDAPAASFAWTDRDVPEAPISSQRPVVTPSGVVAVVGNHGFDLTGLHPSRAWPSARISWTARPGGHIMSTATVGSVVIVTTDAETAVAYDDQGRWLWQQQLSAIGAVDVAGLGDDRFVLALKDGRVEIRDASSGVLQWQTRMNGAATAAMATAPDSSRFYLVDDTGTVHAYSARDPHEEWTAELGSSQARLAGTPAGLFVRTQDEALLLIDGHQQWTTRVYGLGAAQWVGDVAVTTNGGTAVALDLATGRSRWSRPSVRAVSSDGHQVVLATEGRLSAIDADGTELASVGMDIDENGISLVPFGCSEAPGLLVWFLGQDRFVVWGTPEESRR